MYILESVQQIRKIIDMAPEFADANFSMAIGCTYLGWYEKPLMKNVADEL